ncbi:MAG: exo-alpha-sialidase [Phycisphaerae bacterium]|nr:exo-alpha-sialidase [Phycisphaerae bacterium]
MPRYLTLAATMTMTLSLHLAGQTTTPADAKDIGRESSSLRIVGRTVSRERSAFDGAIYAEPTGTRMIDASGRRVSDDNGRTWQTVTPKPDFGAGLPYGYRRDPVTAAVDSKNGWLVAIVNALDTPGLDPKIEEPPVALKTYYLRYRVSKDGGRSWLFEEPIIQAGDYTTRHPLEDLWVGKNSIFLGDAGSIPIVTRAGKILVPAQMTLVGPGGQLTNPGGGWTYTDVVMLIGTWTDSGRITWKASRRIQGDPKRSTRGMIEPTLAEMPDGRILAVMRGSNGGKLDGEYRLPSYRWFSVSGDGGETWTTPEPWGYGDGKPFFSPSSMSTLFRHSTGRYFWMGNVSESNCQGNSPRWPLVIGEVDPKGLRLVRSSVLVVDTERPEDRHEGRLDLSHFTLVEDRKTKEIVMSVPRAHGGYKTWEYATVRVALK